VCAGADLRQKAWSATSPEGPHPLPPLPSSVPPLPSLLSLSLPFLPRPSLPFPSLPSSSPPLPSSFPSPFPSLPLRSRTPLIQLGGLGSAVSSPSGVWGGAPAEIEFGAF